MDNSNGSARDSDQKNVSFWWDERKVERFEDAIWNAKIDDEFDRDATRSDVIRVLLAEFAKEHTEGNGNPATPMIAD